MKFFDLEMSSSLAKTIRKGGRTVVYENATVTSHGVNCQGVGYEEGNDASKCEQNGVIWIVRGGTGCNPEGYD